MFWSELTHWLTHWLTQNRNGTMKNLKVSDKKRNLE